MNLLARAVGFAFWLSLLLMAGCATKKDNFVWVKNGSTEAEFQQDTGQCRAQAFSVPNAPPMQIIMVYDGCMRGKGWNTQDVQ